MIYDAIRLNFVLRCAWKIFCKFQFFGGQSFISISFLCSFYWLHSIYLN